MSLNPRIRDWQGKSVWLVGASTGIGAALARALHARGARVAVSARSRDKLRSLAVTHPGMVPIAVDVLDPASLQQARRELLAQFGSLDFVLFCAGRYTPMRADEGFDLAACTAEWQTNYQGALHLLDAVLPQLLRQRSGHLSLVSSVSGYRGLPKALAYGPTKAALINLAECLYFDLADHGIGVSVVCPGYVETPLTEQNDYHMPGLITADEAAGHILRGWQRGEFQMHFPKRFTAWVKALSHVGDSLYFRAVRRVTGL